MWKLPGASPINRESSRLPLSRIGRNQRRGPRAGIGNAQVRAGRKRELQIAGGTFEEARRNRRHLEGVMVSGTFFRAHLEEARDRLDLASDVSIARALAAADAAEGPGKGGGSGGIVRPSFEHHARALG